MQDLLKSMAKKKFMKWLLTITASFFSSVLGILTIILLMFFLILGLANETESSNCTDYGDSAPIEIVTSEDMEKNAKVIFDYIKTKFPEATDEGICGMLGNFQQESNLNPKAVERPGDDQSGHGLAQWTAVRADQLRSFASKHGKSWDDLGVQLAFLEHELKGAEKAGVEALKVNDVKQATLDWEVKFERAGVPVIQNRVKYAQNWYAKLKGSSVDSDIVDTANDSTDVDLSTLDCGSGDYDGATNEDGWTAPVKNYTGGHNGEQDFGHCTSRQGNWHDGLDYGSAGFGEDKNIYAVHDGKIKSIDLKGQGLGVYVVLDVGDREVAYQEFTMNKSDVLVQVGDEVKAGQPIAKLDSKGGMSGVGSHLHIGVTKKGGNAIEGLAHAFSDDGYWEDPLKFWGNKK